MVRKQLSKNKIEARERIMRKLSYLPLITTVLTLCTVGFQNFREKAQLRNEIRDLYYREYETCDKPGGLERAKKALKRSSDQKHRRKSRLLRDVIAEMEYDRPSRDFQCEIMRNMREKRRSRNW
jgi:hypothetical protein